MHERRVISFPLQHGRIVPLNHSSKSTCSPAMCLATTRARAPEHPPHSLHGRRASNALRRSRAAVASSLRPPACAASSAP